MESSKSYIRSIDFILYDAFFLIVCPFFLWLSLSLTALGLPHIVTAAMTALWVVLRGLYLLGRFLRWRGAHHA
ncbi:MULTISPECIES: hypothetical protein [Spongiibacter]|uniref:hypothetical protein n=1 Tax=Spongiibacter TaxID=630749 RepID=UPI000C6BFB44|nr:MULTISPECIES: hypothetical protein [Spongiibacter]MAY38650.1 hypothetical protein [Spongiibacter sp.]|tara:strand:- start:364 stop:582 length:219 start_codon:yes stop_codon:yes gene_type:complete